MDDQDIVILKRNVVDHLKGIKVNLRLLQEEVKVTHQSVDLIVNKVYVINDFFSLLNSAITKQKLRFIKSVYIYLIKHGV